MLGAVLCLLAAAFAMEAKLGWFSANGHVRVELSSTKLQLADAPRHTVQALSVPAPTSHFPAEIPLFLLFAAIVLVMFVPRPVASSPRPTWFLFSPQHFFRPPPRS